MSQATTLHGVNEITVTARDANGNTASATGQRDPKHNAKPQHTAEPVVASGTLGLVWQLVAGGW